ncbi:unnamed protein product [Paramecium sonneborni]|uniref:RING-type domain-containing protein n=1 Tax=Paramecium sonneborni TaxID=65129 RepID=A0A8S1RL78_9CILI|nr:unnamed protein product [Paramecium sonneborni]
MGQKSHLESVNENENIYDYMSKYAKLSKEQIQVKLQFDGENIDRNSLFKEYHNKNNLIAFYVSNFEQKSISEIKKQPSIGQYGFQKQQIYESPGLNNNNSLKCLNDEQINKSSAMSLESSQNVENFVSLQSLQITQCYFCQQLINDDEQVQLPCQHFYHVKCLNILVENQLIQKKPNLQCLCNQKVQFQILYLLGDKYNAEAQKYRFILNQLQSIEESLKVYQQYRKCNKSKICNFFYLHQSSLKEEHKICPSCLIAS